MTIFVLALTILFSKTSAGVVRQAPVDTVVLDNGTKLLGIAMPTKTVLIPGDADGNGVVNTADIVFTVNQVFGSKKIPPPTSAKDTSNIQVVIGTKLYNFTKTDGKAVR